MFFVLVKTYLKGYGNKTFIVSYYFMRKSIKNKLFGQW